MPLNEAAGYRRSNLTREQIREQEAALYGIKQDDMAPNLSPEEIARMRQILAAHDAQRGGMAEFDLNNPPKVPYRHQEYPRCMYHPDGRTKNANSAEEMEAAIEAGWRKEPIAPIEVEQPAAGAADAAEIARIDAQLQKRGPGRPPKAS